MGKINLLTYEISNLIAAGEVVDRPASVLKELLENSIDAGAREITAEIKRGGASLIRVSDNGCGIESDDLPLAIKRHATSKIKTADDLDSIMTLGFRGEALAAIGAVSLMRIITKTATAPSGTLLVADGGEIVEVCEVGTANGTTIVIEDLFAKLPARRKFLKRDATESMAVAATVEKIAISHPEIAFKLIIDGEQKFATPGDGKLINALCALFGRDFTKRLIAVSGESNGLSVSGYIGSSDNVRGNRNYQNLFINGRYIKSKTIMAALERAYTSYIAPERFPVCALFLDINPALVDVNIHPAKLEVKFSDERAVFESVYYAVRGALQANEDRPELSLNRKAAQASHGIDPMRTFVPLGGGEKNTQLSFGENESSGTSQVHHGEESLFAAAAPQNSQFARVTYTDFPTAPRAESGSQAASSNLKQSGDKLTAELPRQDENFLHNKNTSPSNDKGAFATASDSLEMLGALARSGAGGHSTASLHSKAELDYTSAKKPADEISSSPTFRLVGEAFNCYLFVEQGSELLVIDKHAAHERIIFEELKARQASDGRIGRQSLLIPISIMLSKEELSAAAEYMSEIEDVGFEFQTDKNMAYISSVPDAVNISDAENLFIKMTSELAAGTGNPEISESIRRERALYQVACKAAIKGGRIYAQEQILWLCKRVLELPDITVCPHGRPIAYRLTKSELDRNFERI